MALLDDDRVIITDLTGRLVEAWMFTISTQSWNRLPDIPDSSGSDALVALDFPEDGEPAIDD